MTVIDLFREFSLVSTREEYSPSSRILYYTLLWCWNEQRRPECASMSTKQLCTLAGLKEPTFRVAFAYLADRGWIKRVKSRKHGILTWIMRDRCESVAPPAGFVYSPAQRKSKKGMEESPVGDSSVAVTQKTEVRANVRECDQPDNARPDEVVGRRPEETSGSTATNAEVHDGNFDIEVPDFSY